MTTIRVTRTVEAPPVEAVGAYLERRGWSRYPHGENGWHFVDGRYNSEVVWASATQRALDMIAVMTSLDSSDVYDDMMEEWLAEKEKKP